MNIKWNGLGGKGDKIVDVYNDEPKVGMICSMWFYLQNKMMDVRLAVIPNDLVIDISIFLRM